MQVQHEAKIELIDNCAIPGATRIVDECYKYTDADQIGEGTYGKVYKGLDNKNQKVALKMIRMENEKEGFPITAIREIKLLSTLKHENIVNLREIVRSRVTKEAKYKCDIYMVFDYAEHDLTGLMEATKHATLRPDQIKCIMDQLLRGLAYCHGNGILHRDLKASNLLINREGCLKIADFGLARNWHMDQNGKLTNRVITLWYRPPELLLGAEQYGPAVDVWSVGCIFAELLTRKALFPGNNEAAQLDHIFKLMGRPSEETWPEVTQLSFYGNIKQQHYKVETENKQFDEWCKRYSLPKDAIDLLRKMLELNPAKRISAIDALFHDYFTNSDVKPCAKKDLPKLPDCHEWTTKKRKQQHQQQHPQQMQHGHPHGGGHMPGYGHPQPGGHMPYGPGSAPMRPQYVQPPPAAAAAIGYGGPRGMPPGPDRNVRPRHSGGGMPVGPAGPAAGQAGFKPGAAKPGGYGYGGAAAGAYAAAGGYGMNAGPGMAPGMGPGMGMQGPGPMPPQAGFHPQNMQRGGRGPPQGGYPQHPQQRR